MLHLEYGGYDWHSSLLQCRINLSHKKYKYKYRLLFITKFLVCHYLTSLKSATTLSITAFSITTLSITTFNITTLSETRRKCKPKPTMLNTYSECRFAEYLLCWVSQLSLVCLVSLCWVSLCWASLCWMSLCWMSWCRQKDRDKHASLIWFITR